MTMFTESQRFRQWWLWIGLLFLNLIMVLGLWNNPSTWSGVVIGLLLAWLFYAWQLDTRIDSVGIHYRIFPVLPWRTIPWDSVKSVSVCQYSFVGYGIRWNFDGWVYNVAGDRGLRILYPDGRQITIGTQRPSDLQYFLDQQSVQDS